MNANARCKHCKHWDQDTYELGEFGECRWTNPDWHLPTPLDGFDVVASADDDSNLQSALRTGAEFGCVKFEVTA